MHSAMGQNCKADYVNDTKRALKKIIQNKRRLGNKSALIFFGETMKTLKCRTEKITFYIWFDRGRRQVPSAVACDID